MGEIKVELLSEGMGKVTLWPLLVWEMEMSWSCLAFLKAAHANLRLWMGCTAKGKVWKLGRGFISLAGIYSTDPLHCPYFSLVYVVSGQDQGQGQDQGT